MFKKHILMHYEDKKKIDFHQFLTPQMGILGWCLLALRCAF